MLSDGASWDQALGVQGELETFPPGEWSPWAATAAYDFLKQVIHQ
jgi:hypothetical protein